MAQESGQYHPRLQTYAVIKNGLLILLTSKKILRIKKVYIGFVGSQPMLLLLHQIFRQASKSNNIGCDPTNPMYTFFIRRIFLLALVCTLFLGVKGCEI